jgi:hypothetical protein
VRSSCPARGRSWPPSSWPAAAAAGSNGGASLQACQQAVLYGVPGPGLGQCDPAPAFTGGESKVIRVSGAPDIYTVATQQPASDGTVTIRLSPGLQAYSFTFG